jgi:hypothetical protein
METDMESGREDDYRMSRYFVDLDLTEVLIDTLGLLGKKDEKRILEWLIYKLSGHQVELIRILSQAFPELAKQMPKFFQKRVEDYRNANRFQKLLGFKSMRAIEEKAVRMAWEDTRAMMRQISMMNDDSVRALVDDHRRILGRICAAMVELVKEERADGININLDALRKFLEG